MTEKSTDWSDAELISKALVSARRSAEPLAAYPAALPRSLDIAWGDEIGGWKVARINGQWKDELGSDRYIGPVFSRTIASTGHHATLPVFRHGGAFEAEVALILNDDANPTRLDRTIEDAASLTGTARLVVEAAGAPLTGLAVLGPLASVTAFGNNNGIILGAEYEIKRLKGQTDGKR